MPSEITYIEYGISRLLLHGRKYGMFRVSMMRRRQVIQRPFMDFLYGGKEEALAAARAYRDAVLRAFPPLTTREIAMKVRKNNTSSTPGVYLRTHKGKPLSWIAELISNGIRRRKPFSFSRYGSEQAAFEAAVAMREQWLDKMDAEFFTHSPLAKDIANQRLTRFLDQIVIDDSTKKGFMDKLAAVNALFDAHYPRYLFVKLRIKKGYRGKPYSTLILQVKSLGKEKREKQQTLHVCSLPEALAILRDKTMLILKKDYSPEICTAFMAEHGAIFDENVFDPAKSTRVRFLLTTPCGDLVFSPDDTNS